MCPIGNRIILKCCILVGNESVLLHLIDVRILQYMFHGGEEIYMLFTGLEVQYFPRSPNVFETERNISLYGPTKADNNIFIFFLAEPNWPRGNTNGTVTRKSPGNASRKLATVKF